VLFGTQLTDSDEFYVNNALPLKGGAFLQYNDAHNIGYLPPFLEGVDTAIEYFLEYDNYSMAIEFRNSICSRNPKHVLETCNVFCNTCMFIKNIPTGLKALREAFEVGYHIVLAYIFHGIVRYITDVTIRDISKACDLHHRVARYQEAYASVASYNNKVLLFLIGKDLAFEVQTISIGSTMEQVDQHRLD
jgi:hypothetical protein